MKVAVLGASENPARYAHRAVEALTRAGHEPLGINPALPILPGVRVVASIRDLPPGIHTLTVYLSPERSTPLQTQILDYGFERVIFNPGSENPELQQALAAAGIRVEEACTLVLLATHRFV